MFTVLHNVLQDQLSQKKDQLSPLQDQLSPGQGGLSPKQDQLSPADVFSKTFVEQSERGVGLKDTLKEVLQKEDRGNCHEGFGGGRTVIITSSRIWY